MSLSVSEVQFDVVVVAGPRLPIWPTTGARALAAFCSEMGLSVGMVGGEHLIARGVLPLPGTGGLILADDSQKRIHRIRARAVVRFSARYEIPDPFMGWLSPGLIPLTTAMALQKKSQILWHPGVAILGSGNRALRFGSSLLNQGVPEVTCIESWGQWGAKNFAGWEVERRAFEILGGKFVEGKPLSLKPHSTLLWELSVKIGSQQQSLNVSRVITAGPFREDIGVKEYPPGSLLFEVEQTAPKLREEDIEGWVLEEERSRLLATKISKSLVVELGSRREELQRIYRRSKARLRLCENYKKNPFLPVYKGKWLESSKTSQIKASPGVPKQTFRLRPIASIECFEEIPCDLCEKSCPESAIEVSKSGIKTLHESDCTSCGLCLSACPSQSISLIYERENYPTAALTFAWNGNSLWKVGDFATLTNRRGDGLGSGRVLAVLESTKVGAWVQVEVPNHLAWEARGIRRKSTLETSEVVYRTSLENGTEGKVELSLNGEKRLVREGISVLMALYETGRNRPEDLLFCEDGSCGLCSLYVDGVKKFACQTSVRKGMSIRDLGPRTDKSCLCSCLGIERDEVLEKIKQGKLKSPGAVLSATRVGEGRCHGQLCMESFKRILLELDLDVQQWVDWRFPWTDWRLTPGTHD